MCRSAIAEISDRIIHSGSETLGSGINRFTDYVNAETLAREIRQGQGDHDVFVESHTLDGEMIVLGGGLSVNITGS